MNKREYIQANKDWLEVKAKEEGVKRSRKGIDTRSSVRERTMADIPRLAVLSPHTTQGGL